MISIIYFAFFLSSLLLSSLVMSSLLVSSFLMLPFCCPPYCCPLCCSPPCCCPLCCCPPCFCPPCCCPPCCCPPCHCPLVARPCACTLPQPVTPPYTPDPLAADLPACSAHTALYCKITALLYTYNVASCTTPTCTLDRLCSSTTEV